jgi:hypothetical protein
MASEARQCEQKFSPIAAHDLRNAGATVDGDGAWTFRDGSRGRILDRPMSIKDSSLNIVARQYFECLDAEPSGECQYELLYRVFDEDGNPTLEQYCPPCRRRV